MASIFPCCPVTSLALLQKHDLEIYSLWFCLISQYWNLVLLELS